MLLYIKSIGLDPEPGLVASFPCLKRYDPIAPTGV